MKKLFSYCLVLVISLQLFNCGGGSGSNKANNHQIELPELTVSLEASEGGVVNGATNISTTPIFTLKFSEAIDPATLDSSKIILSTNPEQTNSDITVHKLTLNSEYTLVTFSPDKPLNSLTTYYLSISHEVRTNDGRALQANQFSFTTGDFIKPMLSVTPENNKGNVETSPSIVVLFSKAVRNVDTNTVTLHKDSATGDQVEIEIIEGGDNNYIITTVHPLLEKTDYYLVFSDAIVDHLGNQLDLVTTKFTTGDETGPSVALINILNGSTNVTSKDTTIRFKFSEEVVNVDTETITLQEEGADHPVPINLTSLGNQQYEITPQAGFLKRETNYHLVFSPEITDLSDHPRTTPEFSFTTRKGYIYVVNRASEYKDAYINKCILNKDNNFLVDNTNNCKTTFDIYGARRLVMNKKGNLAYITSRGESNISICSVQESNGDLVNCKKPTLNVKPWGASGLALSKSGTHLFIANADKDTSTKADQLTSCTLDKNGDIVENSCYGFSLPPNNDRDGLKFYSVTLNNAGNQLYLSPDTGNAIILTCPFDGENLTSIKYCLPTHINGYNLPYDVIFNRAGTFAYFPRPTAQKITRFPVNENGTFDYKNQKDYTSFVEPGSIIFSADETGAYVTNSYKKKEDNRNSLFH